MASLNCSDLRRHAVPHSPLTRGAGLQCMKVWEHDSVCDEPSPYVPGLGLSVPSRTSVFLWDCFPPAWELLSAFLKARVRWYEMSWLCWLWGAVQGRGYEWLGRCHLRGTGMRSEGRLAQPVSALGSRDPWPSAGPLGTLWASRGRVKQARDSGSCHSRRKPDVAQRRGRTPRAYITFRGARATGTPRRQDWASSQVTHSSAPGLLPGLL